MKLVSDLTSGNLKKGPRMKSELGTSSERGSQRDVEVPLIEVAAGEGPSLAKTPRWGKRGDREKSKMKGVLMCDLPFSNHMQSAKKK